MVACCCENGDFAGGFCDKACGSFSVGGGSWVEYIVSWPDFRHYLFLRLTVVSITSGCSLSMVFYFLFFMGGAGDGGCLVIDNSVVGVVGVSFSAVSFVVAFATASVPGSTVSSIVLWVSRFSAFFSNNLGPSFFRIVWMVPSFQGKFNAGFVLVVVAIAVVVVVTVVCRCFL